MNGINEAAVIGDHAAVRRLAVGDMLAATPCVVTIQYVTDHGGYGLCAVCSELHVLDRPRYEAGGGPWQPATAASGPAQEVSDA